MPDGQFTPFLLAPEAQARPAGEAEYPPSFTLILQGLDTTELALNQARVSVSAAFLRFLLSEFARRMPFDADFYAATYPDAEAALLAGEYRTLQEHFVRQGYVERRLPYELPFDARYYGTKYDDLAVAFGADDVRALRRHFLRHGWHEGRAGIEAQRRQADRWVAAARDEPADAD